VVVPVGSTVRVGVPSALPFVLSEF
jgi:hypothetical protein